jgi:transposase InsO family protein
MRRKHYRAEEIITKLREAEVLIAQRKKVPEVVKSLGVSAVTYYRWRHEYNTVRPHSSLGYRPPAPETIAWRELPPTLHTHDGPTLTFKVDRL